MSKLPKFSEDSWNNLKALNNKNIFKKKLHLIRASDLNTTVYTHK